MGVSETLQTRLKDMRPTQAVEPAHGSYAIALRICELAVLDALFARLGDGK